MTAEIEPVEPHQKTKEDSPRIPNPGRCGFSLQVSSTVLGFDGVKPHPTKIDVSLKSETRRVECLAVADAHVVDVCVHGVCDDSMPA